MGTQKECRRDPAAFVRFAYFSHFWLATPQLVLQADWQEVWHSPQPPFLALAHRLRVSRVLILFMIQISNLLNDWPPETASLI